MENNKAVISIHPPRAGRDALLLYGGFKEFYFNPPSPCGEGREFAGHATGGNISIHPPRAGRDKEGRHKDHCRGDFNPPSPCGEGLKHTS